MNAMKIFIQRSLSLSPKSGLFRSAYNCMEPLYTNGKKDLDPNQFSQQFLSRVTSVAILGSRIRFFP